jgi:hypothetical protein
MKKIVFFSLFFFSAHVYAITINEVMQSNIGGLMDDLNEFPDSWVEFYNEDTVPINMKNCALSLTPEYKDAYKIELDTVINTNEYFVVYCDKENKRNHTNFRLNSDEDGFLYLFDSIGNVIDYIFIPEMPAPGVSYGKITDSEQWSYFQFATPLKANIGVYSNYILSKPDFSVEGGVCETPFYLKIGIDADDINIPNVTVRYTLDGSEPTINSPVFPDSMLIDKSMVVRAKSFADSAISKPSKTQSYLFLNREVTLPIISIVVDSSFLYNDTIGIYVKGVWSELNPGVPSSVPTVGTYNYCYNWRRPINFEYYDLGGTSASINQICEIRMGGNSSRTIKTKPFVFYANKRFGKKRFSYDFWPWKNANENSKSFYLRNGGVDWYRTHFRDALVQMSFGKYVNIDWLACQPAIVFINGEYYGILNIRERAHEDYVWKNYNKLENVDLIEYSSGTVKYGDGIDYNKFKLMYSSSETTYEDLAEVMDIDEFLNYFIMNSLYSNNDFPGNNYRLWKEKKVGAKWRWFAYDMDQTCGVNTDLEIYKYNFRYLNYILREPPFYDNGYSNAKNSCVLFQKMMSFPEFKNAYIDRMAIYMGTFVSSKRLCDLVDSLVFDIEYEMPYYYDVINRDISKYYSEIDKIKEWFTLRIPFVYQDMKDFFALGDTVSLEIKSEFDAKIYFNEVEVVGNRFSGCYYQNRKFRINQNVNSNNLWIVTYQLGDSMHVSSKENVNELSFEIPDGASNVLIENIKNNVNEETDLEPVLSACSCLIGIEDKVSIYSVDGRLLFSLEKEFDFNRLPRGIYVVIVENENSGTCRFLLKW